MQIPGANPEKASAKPYWIPRPDAVPAPAQKKSKPDAAQRALQRGGAARGKHLDPTQAREIGELFRHVGQWGGW